jgi:nucleotide-binding universal stress UspA family protein
MYRSLLVPLDSSPFGEHALPLALALAARTGATLHLVHVLMPSAVAVPDTPLPTDPRLLAHLRGLQQGYLDAIAKRLQGMAPIKVTTALLDGDVPTLIRDHAVRVGADLVVLTAHGRSPFGRFWLGSVADHLVRHLPMPAVLVRPHEGPVDYGRDPLPRHLLLPLDGTAVAEQVIESAVALGTLAQADYALLRAVRPVLPSPFYLEPSGLSAGVQELLDRLQDAHAQLRREVNDYLEGVAARLRARGLQVRTVVVVEDQPALAILHEAVPPGTDLIALATHGRGGLGRLLLGSVADKVIRGAGVPVLVLRPSAS